MEIKRYIYKDLQREISKPYISILVGPRQAGKTFLLRQLENECLAKGLTTGFYNVEDPRDLHNFTGPDEQIVSLLSGAADVVFMDEFHYLKNATRIFKILYDSNKKIKIFASGSSSMQIHKHLKESLAALGCPSYLADPFGTPIDDDEIIKTTA